MSGHNVSSKVWDYFEIDKKTEEVYPINPLKESRITQGELRVRRAKFYDYDRIVKWKLEQLTHLEEL
jgi:hypothetical protein|tara:strand:- start:47 stop:247 length:201 start_codon:yes stop_codon:yes gene_type:complete